MPRGFKADIYNQDEISRSDSIVSSQFVPSARLFFAGAILVEHCVSITRLGRREDGAESRSIRRENRPTKVLMIFALTAQVIVSDRLSSEPSEGRERERETR